MLITILISILFLFTYQIEKSNKKLFFNDFLSLEQTNSIKGMLALIVMLHHYSQRIEYFSVLDLSIKSFQYVGHLCVAIFFFYSGYGLMSGLETKQNYLNNFIRNKIIKILIPFILVNSIYIIVAQLCYSENFSSVQIFQYIFGIKLINSNAWYVLGILYFYFSFYLSFRYFKKKQGIILLFLLTFLYILISFLLRKGLWWYDSCSTFLFGVIYCKYKGFFIKVSKKYYFYLLSLSLLLFFIVMIKINTSFIISNLDKLVYLFLKHFSALIFTLIIFLFLMKVKIKNKFTILLGQISFEFYLIHKLILDILRSNFIYIESHFKYGVTAILLTCIISTIINYAITNIFKIVYSKTNLIK